MSRLERLRDAGVSIAGVVAKLTDLAPAAPPPSAMRDRTRRAQPTMPAAPA